MDIYYILFWIFLLFGAPILLVLRVASLMDRKNYSKKTLLYFVVMYYCSLILMILINLYLGADMF